MILLGSSVTLKFKHLWVMWCLLIYKLWLCQWHSHSQQVVKNNCYFWQCSPVSRLLNNWGPPSHLFTLISRAASYSLHFPFRGDFCFHCLLVRNCHTCTCWFNLESSKSVQQMRWPSEQVAGWPAGLVPVWPGCLRLSWQASAFSASWVALSGCTAPPRLPYPPACLR